MPAGQKPYKKIKPGLGDKLRSGLSSLRGVNESIGKAVQKAAPGVAKKFPEKKASGGPIKKSRKC